MQFIAIKWTVSLLVLFSTCFCKDEFCSSKGNNVICNHVSSNDDSLRFFILGDWGGKSRYPYTSRTQLKVAKILGTVNKYKQVHFYVSTGDNFYERGVKSVEDSRFKTTFENVYNRKSHQKPWYFVAGNHDYNGNVSAQLEYTNQSSRWNFPSNFYTISYKIDQEKFTADFIMIDTVRMCGHELDDALEQNSELHPDINSSMEAFEWIKKALSQSKAQYLFVVGHYPVTSVGMHGPNKCLYKKLLPLLQEFNVSGYICGHDHNLQHLTIPGKLLNESDSTNFIVSGMASKHDSYQRSHDKIKPSIVHFFYPTKKSSSRTGSARGYSRYYRKKRNQDKGGFVYSNLKKKSGTFIFYDIDGNDLYVFDVKPRH